MRNKNKSDVSRPDSHTWTNPSKSNHPAADASAGTNENPNMKSNDGDVALGEGMDYGAANLKSMKAGSPAGTTITGTTEKSRANQARRENGGADPEGCCDRMDQ